MYQYSSRFVKSNRKQTKKNGNCTSYNSRDHFLHSDTTSISEFTVYASTEQWTLPIKCTLNTISD